MANPGSRFTKIERNSMTKLNNIRDKWHLCLNPRSMLKPSPCKYQHSSNTDISAHLQHSFIPKPHPAMNTQKKVPINMIICFLKTNFEDETFHVTYHHVHHLRATIHPSKIFLTGNEVIPRVSDKHFYNLAESHNEHPHNQFVNPTKKENRIIKI